MANLTSAWGEANLPPTNVFLFSILLAPCRPQRKAEYISESTRNRLANHLRVCMHRRRSNRVFARAGIKNRPRNVEPVSIPLCLLGRRLRSQGGDFTKIPRRSMSGSVPTWYRCPKASPSLPGLALLQGASIRLSRRSELALHPLRIETLYDTRPGAYLGAVSLS